MGVFSVPIFGTICLDNIEQAARKVWFLPECVNYTESGD
jgi:hypothetical protein